MLSGTLQQWFIVLEKHIPGDKPLTVSESQKQHLYHESAFVPGLSKGCPVRARVCVCVHVCVLIISKCQTQRQKFSAEY